MRAPERAPALGELGGGGALRQVDDAGRTGPGEDGNQVRPLLEGGKLAVEGRLPWASNATLLVDIERPGASEGERRERGVYKPKRGERPLWDYPSGLFRREIAVAAVDAVLGWGLVPPTVERDGPYGPGSLQLFVPSDPDEHYFTLLERPEHHAALKAICTLDLLINNGDRKSGHCLLGLDGRVRAIDHGLCLHAEPKLRTVIWDFAGQPVPASLVADVEGAFVGGATGLEALGELVDAEERAALCSRAAALVRNPVFPALRSARAFPWPLI